MTRNEFINLIEKGPSEVFAWLEQNQDVDITSDLVPLWHIAMELNIPPLVIALMDRAISNDHMDYENVLTILTLEQQYLFLSFLFSIGNPVNLENALNAGFSPDCFSPEMEIPVYKTLINQVIVEKVKKPLLHSVLSSLNLPMINLLASRVKDINSVDTLGNTALHDASVILATTPDGEFPLVNLLLEHKADCEIRNNDDLTPLGYLDRMLPVYADEKILNSPLLQQLRTKLQPTPRIILLS